MEKRQSLAGLEKANCHAGESTIWQGPALRWVHSIAVKKTDQSYNCKEINSVKTMRELGRLTLPRWGHIVSQHIDLGFRSWLTETVRKQSATFVAGNLLNSNRQGKQIWHKHIRAHRESPNPAHSQGWLSEGRPNAETWRLCKCSSSKGRGVGKGR